MYYSYSSDENKAVAHIKYGNQEIQTKTLPTTHQLTKFLRFILGGNDAKRYPGFNGIFTSVTFSTADGAFVEKPAELKAYLEKNAAPSVNVPLQNDLLVKEKVTRVTMAEP